MSALLAAALVLVVVPRASADAIDATWTANPGASDATTWQEVVWSPELGLFVAVGGTSTNGAMTSADGISWTARTAPAGRWNAIAWSAELGLFAAVGNPAGGGNAIMTSTDGTVWTARTAPGGSWTDVVWSAEQHQFVGVAVSARSMTSADGVTWTASAAAVQPQSARELTWSAELGLYVTVGNPSVGGVVTPMVFTSADGVAWTQIATSITGRWTAVTYSPEVDLFVSVGDLGIVTSPDGTNWTIRTSPATNLAAVTWSPQNAEFLAAGPDGIVSSPDGVTWTAITNPAANAWLSVVWSPQLARYVGVSNTGTNRTMVGLVPVAPGAPLSLTATVNGEDIALSWTVPAFDGNDPITGYRIERSANGGAFTVLVADTASTATSYDDTTAGTGVSYVYRVFALNSAGASIASNDAAARITGPTLAATGSDAGPLALLALSLLLAGAATVRWRWRARETGGVGSGE